MLQYTLWSLRPHFQPFRFGKSEVILGVNYSQTSLNGSPVFFLISLNLQNGMYSDIMCNAPVICKPFPHGAGTTGKGFINMGDWRKPESIFPAKPTSQAPSIG